MACSITGRVSHGTRHGPGVVEAPAQGDDTSPTNTTVGWLEPDNAAERGRVTYGTTGITAGGERYHVRGQGCA